jgi:hypothetical protein
MLTMGASASCLSLADISADISAVDEDGHNLLHHACLTGNWYWVELAHLINCPLPSGGIKSLVQALRKSKLGQTATVSRVNMCCSVTQVGFAA